MERQSINSETYAQKLANMPKLSKEQKQSALAKILADKDNYMKRLGAAMIGPIQVRLRYEGIVRNVLVEDNLSKGPILPYDVLDDLGQAYILNQTDSEVKITPFEGKQVTPNLFRVASFPRIKKEDLYYLRMNAIEFAQDESRQAIQKAEDARLIALLTAAITSYQVVTGVSVTQNIGVGNPIEYIDFLNAVSVIEQRQIEASRVLINPADARDIYSWDPHVTGWTFKDSVFGGETVTKFGEFTLQKSIIVPQGKVFIVPEPKFLGVMPVMYSLDVEENNQVEQFYKGWVMDELIGMVVLNPRGLSLISKS
jgi:hypothetical protein